MNDFTLNLPLNRTSLGQVSICIAKEIYKRGLNPCIFPIGGIDLISHKIDKDFNSWLTEGVQKSQCKHSRHSHSLKLWHLNGGLEKFSDNQSLFTFQETDQFTEAEINVIHNQNHVFFSNNYLVDIAKSYGLHNVSYCPLGYDAESFYKLNKKYYNDDRIVFGIFGKFEQRKGHLRAIQTWCKKYANNKKYMLHLSIGNSFLTPEQNNQILGQIFGSQKPWNVNISNISQTNAEYNDVLNSIDIVIDASHNENWSLPSFQAVGLGKWGVLHGVCGISEWANNQNSVLFEPNGKMLDIYDNMFFGKGQQFSQGKYYDWNEESLIVAMEKAEKLAKTPNPEGEKLRETFSYSRVVDTILQNL